MVVCRRVMKELAARTLEPGLPMSEQDPYKMGLCITKVQTLLYKAHYQTHEIKKMFSRLLTRRGRQGSSKAVSPLSGNECPVGDGQKNKARSRERAEQANLQQAEGAAKKPQKRNGQSLTHTHTHIHTHVLSLTYVLY